MSNLRYDWGNGPPPLENHSRCKHEIIRDYLVRYMCVVAKGFLPFKDKTFNLTIVDGFAGGGKYLYRNSELVDGSPLILLKAVKEASVLIHEERKQLGRDSLYINSDFFFVEKERAAFEYLQRTLKNEEDGNGKTHVRHGEFNVHLPAIIKFIKAKSRGRRGRAIFILDQCGFSQVLLDQLKQIMTSLDSEVILTFAVDSLVAYLCEKKKLTLKRMGFTDDNITQILQQENPDECRGIIQHVLSRYIWEMGFSFTPFCIYGDTSNWGYWLIHLSSHHRARDEMTNIHWNKGNELVHYGSEGIDMFGYRSKKDENYTGQLFLGDAFRFDNYAKEKVLNSLPEELSKFIHEKKEILFKQLMSEILNHTPATKGLILEALEVGVINKEFTINHRNVKNIKGTDLIKQSSQLIIKV